MTSVIFLKKRLMYIMFQKRTVTTRIGFLKSWTNLSFPVVQEYNDIKTQKGPMEANDFSKTASIIILKSLTKNTLNRRVGAFEQCLFDLFRDI